MAFFTMSVCMLSLLKVNGDVMSAHLAQMGLHTGSTIHPQYVDIVFLAKQASAPLEGSICLIQVSGVGYLVS